MSIKLNSNIIEYLSYRYPVTVEQLLYLCNRIDSLDKLIDCCNLILLGIPLKTINALLEGKIVDRWIEQSQKLMPGTINAKKIIKKEIFKGDFYNETNRNS